MRAVFRSAALDALAQAARAGEDHVARRVLARADPLLAAFLRRSTARSIRWASACVADPSDRGHVLRLAYLRAAGALGDVGYEDRAAVAEAFDKARAAAPAASQTWFASIAVASIAVIAALGMLAARRPRFDPRDTPLGQALGPDLTAYVATISQLRAHSGELRPPDNFTDARDHAQNLVSARLGPALGGALVDVFRSYQAAALSLGPGRAELDAFAGSVQQLNAALRSQRQPYFLDFFTIGAGEPVLTSYYVARERTATVAGSAIRLVWVRRLDDLNKSLAVLGYTSPRAGAGVVTLDTIERDLVTVVAPALDEGRIHLVDRETRDTEEPWIADVERAGGQTLRRDHERYRTPAQDRMVALIARRDALYWRFVQARERTQATLVRPRRLVEPDPLNALEGLVAPSELREWREDNESLGQAAMQAAFDDVPARFADRVERHELEHQIDFREGLVTVPDDLRSALRLTESEAATDVGAARCRDQLSAGLAEVATDPAIAATALTLWMAALFDRERWSTPYAYAAAVMLAAVARELGAGGDPTDMFRGLQRRRAAEIFVAVVAHGGDEIARAASSAFTRLYGRPLPPLEFGPWTVSRAWRR